MLHYFSYPLQSKTNQRVIYTYLHFFTFIYSFFPHSLLSSLQYEVPLVKTNDDDHVASTVDISLIIHLTSQQYLLKLFFFHLNAIFPGFIFTLLTITSHSPFLTLSSLFNFGLIVEEPQDSVHVPFLSTLST